MGARGGSRARERALLEAARRDDGAAFGQLVEPYRAELHAHCYRMLGSVQDAEDALQDAMLGAWRGLAGFEGRSSLRAWLYRIATNACLRLLRRRPRRLLAADRGPAANPEDELGEPVLEPVWLEPYPDERLPVEDGPAAPEARYELRESVELAFVAALQHLPATQRAVLILREVLGFPAAEVARILDTTPASVNSALQRARKALDERAPRPAQRAELAALGADGRRELVDAFVDAWERADVAALLRLLAEDARFTMPPLPAWFLGRDDVGRFFAERIFATRGGCCRSGRTGSSPSPATRATPAAPGSGSARSTCCASAPGGSWSSPGSWIPPCTATSACRPSRPMSFGPVATLNPRTGPPPEGALRCAS